MLALDGLFERSMLCAENKKIAGPRNEEYVVLNCIYFKTFTVMDQLSLDRFDVEQIVPKEQTRKLIEAYNGEGLPIRCTLQEITGMVITPASESKQQSKKVNFADKCVLRLGQSLDSELVKAGCSSYVTADGKRGYVITVSKVYKQGKRDKYWFAYRRNPLEDLKNCEETFVVYGCKDGHTMLHCQFH